MNPLRILLLGYLLWLCFDGISNGQESEPEQPGGNGPVEEIIVVCKTHFDIGYTHRVCNLIPHYRTKMIDQALKAMDQSNDLPREERFVWTGPGWVMAKVVEDWEGQSPERKRRLEKAFASGRMVSHAMAFTPHSDIMHPEEVARAYSFAHFISRKFGLPLPRDAKTTDVPSHGRMLATCLARGGVKFLHIGCNWPSGNVDLPPLFWWEGPDGSRVMTFYSPIYGTCTGLWPAGWGGARGSDHPTGGVGTNLLPPENWPHKAWLAVVVTPDNSGPPKVEQLKPLFREVAEKMPGVKIRMGRMEEFADVIIASRAELPVVKMETPDSWIHGMMSDPGAAKLLRRNHFLLPAAESLNTHLKGWGISAPDVAGKIALAWENSALYSEHTFGRSRSPKVYGEAFTKLPGDSWTDLEFAWGDKLAYIRKTDEISNNVLSSGLKSLAVSAKKNGPCAIVYNPLPWPRSASVEVPGKPGMFLEVRDVPACGYKVVPLPKKERAVTSREGTTLENEYYRIVLDPAGGRISSLVDKRTRREWAGGEGIGRYLNERFTLEQTQKYVRTYQRGRAVRRGKAWLHPGLHKPGMVSEKEVPYRALSPSGGTVRIHRDAVGETAVMKMPGDPKRHLPTVVLKVRLERKRPYADLEITLRDKPRDNWPEADWLCLSFDIENPRFHVARPLGMMDPTKDIVRGANRTMYAVGPGMAITGNDGGGVAVCPLDHPLISLDQPGCWKYSLDFVPQKPVVYLNLYNNQWNTNFRYWYSGTWSSRVRLWTLGKGEDVAEALGDALLEAQLPLMAVPAEGTGGDHLPKEQRGVTVSRKGIQVTAFGIDPFGSGKTLLRLWEMSGRSGGLTIALPEGKAFTKAIPVDLRSEPVGPAKTIKDGNMKIELGAYAPASFLLE